MAHLKSRFQQCCAAQIVAFSLCCLASGSAVAEAGQWYPFKVYDRSSGKPEMAEYVPLGKAEKPYRLCVLFPHMKDSFWVAVDYGIAKEAEALGVNMNLYQAGGYDNLPKQLSQFDDCIANGADAIILGTISEVGVDKELATAKSKGIPVVAVSNDLTSPDLTAGIYVDTVTMGATSANEMVNSFKPGTAAEVVTFPGPAGSGWAEEQNDAFKAIASKRPDTKVLESKFGDTGVAVQLQLVQDALQSYPSMNAIWGTAPTAEAAIGALAEIGRSDVRIVSTYENEELLDALKRGDIMAFATQYPVGEGRIAVDQAVRILEKKPYMKLAQPIPAIIDKGTMKSIDMSVVLAPKSWSPVYSVKQ